MQPQSNASPEAYSFDPTILREYDIRGQIDKNLSAADAYALGLAFGTFVARQNDGQTGTICVGYDGRLTSPEFCDALTKGLLETGQNVTQIGLGPTPMLYFSVKDRKADAGIMITGSHNPADYNGFKMTLLNAPVFGELIQEIGQIAASGDFISGQGQLEKVDIKDHYVDRLMQDFTGTRDLTVAWDAGNGAAGEILRLLTAKLPGKHILLFDDIDGTFPNHHPDPTVDKNLVDLQKAVADNDCDLGIAFDGDGDRIGVVDEKGTVLRCDMLMTLYAREVLETHPGASIIGDVKCSQVMFDEINKMGGNAVMWKTGHSLIKDKMRETGSPLAGELSGHIFFADKYYGFDDALYCAVRLLNEVDRTQDAFSSLTAHLPQLHSTPEIRIEVDEAEKFGLVPRIAKALEGNLPAGMVADDIDGIRVSSDEGWWLLRPSNTQAVLVCRAEANSAEALDRFKQMILQEIEKVGYVINF